MKVIKYEDVVTYENLLRAYYHCRQGKTTRNEVVKFHLDLTKNINKLYTRLIKGTYRITDLYSFIIYEPKKREITANQFEDKIVQRLMCKHVLEPAIQPMLIYDNYATQEGKGSALAEERIRHNMNAFSAEMGYTNNGFVLSCDIHHFFYEINREICMKMIRKLPIDKKLQDLMHTLIYAIEDFDGSTRGLCIGFQTSQWLAVYYLNGLDHFIKEKLQIKYYGRYMDDFYLIHKDKEYLKHCYKEIKRYVEDKLDLELNPKSQIHPYAEGIRFIGFNFRYNLRTHNVDMTVLPGKVLNEKRKLTKHVAMVEDGIIERSAAIDSLESWHGHAKRGETEKSKNLYEKTMHMLGGKEFEPRTMAEYRTTLEDTDFDSNGFIILRKRPKKKDGSLYGDRFYSTIKSKRKMRWAGVHMERDIAKFENLDMVVDDDRYLPLPPISRNYQDKNKHEKSHKRGKSTEHSRISFTDFTTY